MFYYAIMSILSIYVTQSSQCRSATWNGQSIVPLDICFQGQVAGTTVSHKVKCDDNKASATDYIHLSNDCSGFTVDTEKFDSTNYAFDCNSDICATDTYAVFSLYIKNCDISSDADYGNFAGIPWQCIPINGVLDQNYQFSANSVSAYITCELGANGLKFKAYDQLNCAGNVVEILPLYPCNVTQGDNKIDFVRSCPDVPPTASPVESIPTYSMQPTYLIPTKLSNIPTTIITNTTSLPSSQSDITVAAQTKTVETSVDNSGIGFNEIAYIVVAAVAFLCLLILVHAYCTGKLCWKKTDTLQTESGNYVALTAEDTDKFQ